MPVETTFAMVKSKAVNSSLLGRVMDRILISGFTIIRAQQAWMTPVQINTLYFPHAEKPYYQDLVDSVGHGVVIMALAREGAIGYWRDIMGATNPKEATPNTIRHWARTEKRMADNIVHGSANVIDAKWELRLFFPGVVF